MPLSFTVNQSQEETRKEVCMCTEMTTTNVVIFQELTENIKEIERLICNKSREKSGDNHVRRTWNRRVSQRNRCENKYFRHKKRNIREAFLSVFIIHIHIDRFLIQHGFDSVTVFQLDLFFLTRITIKNDKDNTMYDSLLNFYGNASFEWILHLPIRMLPCHRSLKPFKSTWLGSPSFIWHPLQSSLPKMSDVCQSNVTLHERLTNACIQFHTNKTSSVSCPSPFPSRRG